MKKHLNELNKGELIKVFETNHRLQEKVFEDMVESEMFWIEECLRPIEKYLSSWSIGMNNRDQHIRVGEDYRGFVEGVKKMQEDFCFLHDDESNFIDEVDKLIEVWYDTNQFPDSPQELDRLDALEEEVESKVKELSDKIVKQFDRQLDALLDEDIQLDYFLGFYLDERMDEDNCYIDENFTLYEEVSFTRSYK